MNPDVDTKTKDLLVIQPLKDFTCTNCAGTDDFLIMEGEGPLCMACADLDHLEFLAAGDAALSRRAKKASTLWAVVVRFSRSRRRYERQGLLVEAAALELAEQQCLADEDVRARRRARAQVQRERGDVDFARRFAAAIGELFPRCPSDRATAIAEHAAVRGSGRVGRSAAGQTLDTGAVTAAVVASVRHVDTPYDSLLMAGVARADARDRVRSAIDAKLDTWR